MAPGESKEERASAAQNLQVTNLAATVVWPKFKLIQKKLFKQNKALLIELGERGTHLLLSV